jgi:hypothetical protein
MAVKALRVDLVDHRTLPVLHGGFPLEFWSRAGAADGGDLLILKGKIKRSQPPAAPTVEFQATR